MTALLLKVIVAAIGVSLTGRYMWMGLVAGIRGSLLQCGSCRMFVARSDWQTHQRVHIRSIEND